jgi:hypothetical protein
MRAIKDEDRNFMMSGSSSNINNNEIRQKESSYKRQSNSFNKQIKQQPHHKPKINLEGSMISY